MAHLKISYTSKGDFDNALKWLSDVPKKSPTPVIDSIAEDGVKQLQTNTPRDTGMTSAGWFAEVKMTTKGLDIIWKNRAHPELNVNLAKLIELGHGTRNGGYVSPRPYIKQSMDSVFKTAGDKLAGELYK